MSNLKGLLCYSRRDFEKVLSVQGIFTVSDIPKNLAVIQILETLDCLKYYNSDDEFYFKEESDRVLNLQFDDLDSDLEKDGFHFKTITEEQAENSVKFILEHLGDSFIISCRAGKSRSQAFIRFILDTFPERYDQTMINILNPPITPNIEVLSKLKRAFRELTDENT